MPPRHHHSSSPRQPPDLPQPIPPRHRHSLTTVTFVLSAIAAAVAGYGWRIGHHSCDEPPIEPPNILAFLPRAVRRQTTIVVAVKRRYTHHSRTLWCRAVMAQPHGMSRVGRLDLHLTAPTGVFGLGQPIRGRLVCCLTTLKGAFGTAVPNKEYMLAWMGWNADIEGRGLGELCTYDEMFSFKET
ncbi:hypothetical protein Tco_0469532 [Tanacetum coccineum]